MHFVVSVGTKCTEWIEVNQKSLLVNTEPKPPENVVEGCGNTFLLQYTS